MENLDLLIEGDDLFYAVEDQDFAAVKKAYEGLYGSDDSKFAGTKMSGLLLVTAIFRRKHDAAFFFLEKGAAVNVQNEDGFTPVNALAYMHTTGKAEDTDYELMKLLLDKGADLNIPTNNRIYPLLKVTGRDKEMFSLMLDYNPDIYRCRQVCIEMYHDYYPILEEKGLIEKDESKMDLYGLAMDGSIDTFKQRFDGKLLRTPNKHKDTLIECAIYGRNWEVVKFLLEQGIDINEPVWISERTVLAAVIKLKLISPNENTPKDARCYSPETMEFIKYLLDHGADVNAGEYSPLFTAALSIYYTNDQVDVFNMLLDYNPKIDEDFIDSIEYFTKALEILKERGFIK